MFFFLLSKPQNKEVYLQKLDKIFENSLLDPNSVIVIVDANIKNKVTSSISYVHSNLDFVIKTVHHTINITTIKTELFAIRCGINQVIQISDTFYIIIITNAIYLTR